jgi:hypothetical protein
MLALYNITLTTKQENIMKLLSIGTNAKTVKSDAIGDYLTAIKYMAPHTIASSKYNFCTGSSPNCRSKCLFFSGMGKFTNVKQARINRSLLFIEQRDVFKAQLLRELTNFTKRCIKADKIPVVRLNGTTDIIYERVMPEIFTLFPTIQFYDYTKVASRITNKLPSNYHLTFSMHEENLDKCKLIIKNSSTNVAVVFSPEFVELPSTFLGRQVIDGTKHDLRFIDPDNVIVGLIANGKAKNDESGFVITKDLMKSLAA